MNAWQRRLQQNPSPDARRVIVKHELIDAMRTMIKKLEDMGPDEMDRVISLADDGELWGIMREVFEPVDEKEERTGRMKGVRYEVTVRAAKISRASVKP